MMQIYYACAYLRLSEADDDKGRNDESNSIKNQRNLIEEYIRNHPEIELVEEKVDDGFSGVYFDRPAFQEMIKDIENKKINCVIVKDLSRFGRNYIESGHYQEYFFSIHQVRFIAVNDGIDLKPGEENDTGTNLILPFKNIINDAYSRDISIKTKSHLDIRRKKGYYLSAFAPYGYQKDTENKNRLVIDDYAATIVKEIFNWKLEGFSTTQIAEKLNNSGVLAPGDYKKSIGMNYKSPLRAYEKSIWYSNTVKRILTNKVYLGHLIQGRTKKISLKIKKSRLIPHEKWVVVENTHTPIITAEDFELVQNLFKMDSRVTIGEKEQHLLSGFLFCSACGEKMIHKAVNVQEKTYDYYICSSYARNKNACTSHKMDAKDLETVLFSFLRQHIVATINIKRILDVLKEMELSLPEEEIQKQNIQISNLKEQLKKNKELKIAIYEDWKEELLDKKEYQELSQLYEQKGKELDRALEEVKKNYKRNVHNIIQKNQWMETFIQCQKIEKLSRWLLMQLVNKIIVFDNSHIKIDFRFDYEFNEVLSILGKMDHVSIV